MNVRTSVMTPVDAPPIGKTVEIVSRYEDFLSLEREWNELAEASGVDHPFLRHEWFRTWWDAFGDGHRLHLVLMRRRGRLVGIAPLMKMRRWVYGVPLRTLRSIYNVHTPVFEFLIDPECPEAYATIWNRLRFDDSWDLLELNQMPFGSPTLERIESLARADGMATGTWWAGDSPYVDIDGDWDDYWSSLRGKHRSNMRNRLNRLNKIGPAELEEIRDPVPALDRHLREGLRIEASGWKGKSGTAIACENDVLEFYSRIAHGSARSGALRLHFLKVGDRRVAFAYSLLSASRLYLLKTGYDPEYHACSPFNVLCLKVLESCFRHGIREYNFLGVHDSWKRDWTDRARPNYWLYVFSGSARSRLARWLKFSLLPAARRFRGDPGPGPSPFAAPRGRHPAWEDFDA